VNAEQFNAQYPVGTRVAAFPITRDEEPLLTRTRSVAWELGHGAPVVKAEGYAGGIALTHVDPMAEAAAVCRCDEPDADPYSCEADDCTAEFSELNPFGGGPVEGHDAKVSRTCGCGWRTSSWHVDDGSAEAELHGHVVRVHGGTYPATGGA
jgi:hypothetical protein